MKIKILRLYKPDGEMLQFEVGERSTIPNFSENSYRPISKKQGYQTMDVVSIDSIIPVAAPVFVVSYSNGMKAEFGGYPFSALYE